MADQRPLHQHAERAGGDERQDHREPVAQVDKLRQGSCQYEVESPQAEQREVRAELRQIVAHAHEHKMRVVAPLVEDAKTAAGLWSAHKAMRLGLLTEIVPPYWRQEIVIPG